eukprot:48567-Rhodomonas_salina.2
MLALRFRIRLDPLDAHRTTWPGIDTNSPRDPVTITARVKSTLCKTFWVLACVVPQCSVLLRALDRMPGSDVAIGETRPELISHAAGTSVMRNQRRSARCWRAVCGWTRRVPRTLIWRAYVGSAIVCFSSASSESRCVSGPDQCRTGERRK